MQTTHLASLLKDRIDLNWSSPNTSHFSDSEAFEAILNYGDWADVQTAIQKLGFNQAKVIFSRLAKKTRSNLRPEIKHYFNLYFTKNASRNTKL